MELNMRLQLLTGQPINVESYGDIHPLKLKEIVRYGYSKYLESLNILSLEPEELLGDMDVNNGDIRLYDVLLLLGGEEIQNELCKSLSFFLNEATEFDVELNAIIVGSGQSIKTITRDNFDDVRKVIQIQNGLDKDSMNKENPKDDKAKAILDKLNKGKKKVEELKKKNNENEGDIDVSDIISSVSSKSYSINKINIVDLTIYQLYEEFKRLELIDQYEISIKSLMQGAKNVKIKHWSSKLQD